MNSRENDERMRRYALFAVLHGAVVVAAVLGLLGSDWPWLLVIASVPLVFAWGSFQVDVTFNPEFGEAQRNLWRAALWLLPWTMTFYWHRYVRPRQVAADLPL